MVKVDLLCQIWCFLSVLGWVELKRRGIVEDTGDAIWDAEASYLLYEEPEYNRNKGFTKDDFVDNLQGFQTEENIARSFGWEMSTFGETPSAALLVSHQLRRAKESQFCMGTVITTMAVITPCGCVRNFGEKVTRKGIQDEYNFDIRWRHYDKIYKYYYYEYDLGLDIDVITNHVEYIEEDVGRGFYPKVKTVNVEQCYRPWSFLPKGVGVPGDRGPDGFKRYQQMFYPAIAFLNKPVDFDAVCPWPPFVLEYKYHNGTYKSGNESIHFFYSNDLEEGHPTSAIITSYKFIPLEEVDLSVDNDARGPIKTENRLVNLHVELCNQSLCHGSDGFEKLNHVWVQMDNLRSMLCWCDVPWLGDEVIYQNLKHDEAPVYLKSVFGGIFGAPIIHHGVWLGWTVETVTRNATKQVVRSVWSRGIDLQMVKFFEDKLPDVMNQTLPRPGKSYPENDINRGSFAVHDFKDFVPDADIKISDLDLQSWEQIGNPRFLKLKLERRRRSEASAILPTLVVSLIGIFIALS